MQRFLVHLQYNNDVIISLFIERVQGYTLKTNRRRCTNKVSNPMFSMPRSTINSL